MISKSTKSGIILVAAFFLLNFYGCDQAAKQKASGPDFREVRWGMTMDEVKKAEKAELENEMNRRAEMAHQFNLLFYQTSYEGLTSLLLYGFENNKLNSGTYFFGRDMKTPQDFVTNFDKIKGIVTKTMGKPVQDKLDLKNPHQKLEPKDYGHEMVKGNLRFYTGWQQEDKEVDLALWSQNGQMIFRLQTRPPQVATATTK